MIRSKNSVFVKIKELVKEIPEGKVSTYGNVARAVGIDNPRVVGWALRGNQNKLVPCHRVVKKDGYLATNFSLGGWREQRRRLMKDGVKKICGQRIDDFENIFWDLLVKLKKK